MCKLLLVGMSVVLGVQCRYELGGSGVPTVVSAWMGVHYC